MGCAWAGERRERGSCTSGGGAGWEGLAGQQGSKIETGEAVAGTLQGHPKAILMLGFVCHASNTWRVTHMRMHLPPPRPPYLPHTGTRTHRASGRRCRDGWGSAHCVSLGSWTRPCCNEVRCHRGIRRAEGEVDRHGTRVRAGGRVRVKVHVVKAREGSRQRCTAVWVGWGRWELDQRGCGGGTGRGKRPRGTLPAAKRHEPAGKMLTAARAAVARVAGPPTEAGRAGGAGCHRGCEVCLRERYDARGSESRRLGRMASAGGRARTAQQKDGALHSSTATVAEWRGRPESIQRELQRGRMLAMAMTATSGTPSTHTRVHAQARTSTHAQHTRSTCARTRARTHTHTHRYAFIKGLSKTWDENGPITVPRDFAAKQLRDADFGAAPQRKTRRELWRESVAARRSPRAENL